MRVERESREPTARAIEKAAYAALRKSGETGLSDVRCEYRDGVLTLHGRVNTYYQKQLAQVAARPADRRITVDNQIRVVSVAAGERDDLEQILASLQRQQANERAAGEDAEAPGVAP
jgi:hypothetical protein